MHNALAYAVVWCLSVRLSHWFINRNNRAHRQAQAISTGL